MVDKYLDFCIVVAWGLLTPPPFGSAETQQSSIVADIIGNLVSVGEVEK